MWINLTNLFFAGKVVKHGDQVNVSYGFGLF
jgi:hypothetical protein